MEAPLGADLRIDLGTLEDAFRQAVAGGRRAAYLLCSPHNPTGTVHSAEELAAVAALADRYGVRVVADEIHAPLTASGVDFVPYLSVPGAEHGLSLMSAVEGMEPGGAESGARRRGPGGRRRPRPAARGGQPRPQPHRRHRPHGRPDATAPPGWTRCSPASTTTGGCSPACSPNTSRPIAHRPGEATYLAWLDCRALGLGDDPAAVFLERGRVAVNSGIPFGTGGAGHVRLNLATSPEVITEGVRRMAAALD